MSHGRLPRHDGIAEVHRRRFLEFLMASPLLGCRARGAPSEPLAAPSPVPEANAHPVSSRSEPAAGSIPRDAGEEHRGCSRLPPSLLWGGIEGGGSHALGADFAPLPSSATRQSRGAALPSPRGGGWIGAH